MLRMSRGCKEPRGFHTKNQGMLSICIDYNGVVLHQVLADDHTVNNDFYLGIMRRLFEVIRQNRFVGEELVDFATQ